MSNAPHTQCQPGTTSLIGPTDCLRDEIAERIWRSEYRRATGKERVIEWAEVGEPEVIKYLYLAEAILQLPSIATLQARVEELTADCAHISARWIAETRHNEELTKALTLARNRIAYLGEFGNERHQKHNDAEIFPVIDRALGISLEEQK